MRVEMNWADVSFGVILLCLVVVLAAAWCFVDKRRVAAFEQSQRRAFEQDMTSVELPEWNGDTYDWTPESLAYLADENAYEPAEFPVPASEVSGPMPVQGAPVENDADEFVAKLKADNAAFLANLELQ